MGLGFLLFLFLLFQFGIADARVIDSLQLLFEHFLHGSDVFESAIIGTSEYGMSVTFVYWIQNALSSVPMWAFALAAFAAYFGIGFAIQSTSAVAGMTMSILGAVAMALFAGTAVSPEAGQMVLISAFTMGLNLSASGLFPEASKMGVLELTGIPYPTYLAVATKMFIPITIAGLAVLMLAPYIGIAG